MIYFTSDHHFGHANILKFQKDTRVFSNVWEMDKALIAAWNSVVVDGDTVYHLGDFSFSSPSRTNEIFYQLNGQKHLIAGNHDKKQTKALPWISQNDYREVTWSNFRVCLFHYPIEVWNGAHHGSIHLHGHSHGHSAVKLNRFDVGVDPVGFSPVTLDWLLTNRPQTGRLVQHH